MPDLREESPSKIAAGFGGTLNLVISAIYIVTIVLLTALPTHFYLVMSQTETSATRYDAWLLAGIGAALLTGIVATVVPMRLGLRSFRSLEF
jgi:ABC-2 type transport system permease protein